MKKRSTNDLVAQRPNREELAALARYPISVVCDNVRSLHNVGLIFRLCDAARIERLYLCGVTGYPPIPNDVRPPWVAERAGRVIAKTAIHTVEYVPWEYHPDAAQVIGTLKQGGTQIVALEQTNRSVDYTGAHYRFPLSLVLGHEREGIASPLLDLTDIAVEIPMHGRGNSLNVAMALGICLYELLRRRRDQIPGPD
jgi:tRNA G18 (ribose-2'-O)-methylase SpoU